MECAAEKVVGEKELRLIQNQLCLMVFASVMRIAERKEFIPHY